MFHTNEMVRQTCIYQCHCNRLQIEFDKNYFRISMATLIFIHPMNPIKFDTMQKYPAKIFTFF